MTGDKRVYLVDGIRTPFLKAGNKPGPFSGGDLTAGCGDNVPARTV